MPKKFSIEVRIYAFGRKDNGDLEILDIVETSRHFAPYYARYFIRHSADCVAIAATLPGNTIMPVPRFIDGKGIGQ